MMRRLFVFAIVVCLGVFFFTSSSPVFAQDEAAVVKSFKDVVKRVDDYFSASPVVLHSEDYPYSPSGQLNYLLRFTKIETSFDVTKTSSLISPYTAYIVLRLRASSNRQFGDIRNPLYGRVPDEYEHDGFQKAEDATKLTRFASCTSPGYDEQVWCVGNVKLGFAFQDNEWVFKDADLPDDSRIKDGQTARVLRLSFLNEPEWKRVLSGKK